MGRSIFLFWVLCLFISGCGSGSVPPSAAASGASTDTPKLSGLHLDKAYTDLLEKEFKEAVECTALEGDFWELAIFLYPPPHFECVGTNNQGESCYGEFLEPNKVLLARLSSWKHEVIHYLLYQNTGDLDPGHGNTLFEECG